jgi:ribosome maturation factor RimP
MSKLTDKISALAEPVAQGLGLSLWDVEYLKEAGQWYLRIYIDKQGGVAIEDCESLSRALDEILDETDPIAESYTFEVSSAGAERELKRESDFERFKGSNIEVKLYTPQNGAKSYTGQLLGYNGGDVTINAPSGEKTFTKQQVAQVRLRLI